ncbi:hypothetical protein KLP28_11775 [Nocardioidaceae bacterium]|nr:hypothetical protein KLP28_11775 [Nocardioidaceae bacterium]
MAGVRVIWLVLAILAVVLVAAWLLRRARVGSAGGTTPAVGPLGRGAPSDDERTIGNLSFVDDGDDGPVHPWISRHQLAGAPYDQEQEQEQDEILTVEIDDDAQDAQDARDARDVSEHAEEVVVEIVEDDTPREPVEEAEPVEPAEPAEPVEAPYEATDVAQRATLPDDDVWNRILGIARGEIPVPEPEPEPEPESEPEPELEIEWTPEAPEAPETPASDLEASADEPPPPMTEPQQQAQAAARVRRCGHCRQIGHDRRSCPELVGPDQTD